MDEIGTGATGGLSTAPKLLKGGLVLLDSATGIVQRIISLQYNPGTLSRSLQTQGAAAAGDRTEALRLTGPPTETYTLEAEIDATDQLAEPGNHAAVVSDGLMPHLAALETVIYPENASLLANNTLAAQGALEILPVESPLTLFVWSKNRVLPVRITQFTVTEEAFDPSLNPIRARLSLSMRVLNINDLGFDVRGGNLFLAYHRQLEALAGKHPNATFATLGVAGI